jgi:hypothetical protein
MGQHINDYWNHVKQSLMITNTAKEFVIRHSIYNKKFLVSEKERQQRKEKTTRK